MDYPKLRNVEIFPITIEGQKLICFRDPLKISEKVIFLPRQALPLVAMFDGKHSIREIQAEYMRNYGELLYSDQIQEVAVSLDEYLLLDSDRFRAFRKRIEDEFSQSPTRKALLAGGGYDADPEKLRRVLDAFFLDQGGPGSCHDHSCSPAGLRGCVAPHIDFMRGGFCYAWAYKEVAEHSDEDTFVLLGTSHMQTKRLFVLTGKHFETPFGTLITDRKIVGQLQSALGDDFFDDEFLHRNEHSLEFQTVFLSYLFSGRRKVTIVPILCGSFHEIMSNGRCPSQVEELNTFIEALDAILADDGRQVCVVAGADLAHVGPQFGDRYQITPGVMESLKAKDLSMLDYAAKGDADGFYEYIRRENDERKICGLPPIYTLLRLLKNSDGRLLNYSQWSDPAGQGAVTFASMAFYDDHR